MMSATPRTDDAAAKADASSLWSQTRNELVAFARTLERENAKLCEDKARLDSALDRINEVAAQMEQLGARVETTESERLTWKTLAANLREPL